MNERKLHPGDPVSNLGIGTLIEVDGTRIVAEMDSELTELARVFGGVVYPIGQFGSIVRIHYGRNIIYGYVSRLRMKADYQRELGMTPDANPSDRIIEADLFGQGEWVHTGEGASATWRLEFERGVSTFPLPQQRIYLTPISELKLIFGQGIRSPVVIGEHVGSGGAPAYADMNELFGKHSAILGSTGSGKSGAVASVLHALLERGEQQKFDSWNPIIIIFDPHNEYGTAFAGHRRFSTDEGSLRLPYWLLDLSETLALIIGKTEFEATSQANIVKSALLAARQHGTGIIGMDAAAITVDSPVPYTLAKLQESIESSKPVQASKQESHNKILQKLDLLCRDKRLAFMMEEWDGKTDSLGEIVAQFLGDGPALRIVDLSGVPNEVAGVTSSVIARMLFQVKLWQTAEERRKTPVLIVCEEAHRYVPNRGEAMYEAAQDAIRRLAKEGRKYGIGLLLVSQRPSEVEATVLSQCSSWIVMRMTNDADREHVKSILPDSLSGLTKILSGLRRREAVFAGQATLIPSRIMITKLEPERLPRSQDVDFDGGWQNSSAKPGSLQRLRGAGGSSSETVRHSRHRELKDSQAT